ncbi:hypothetical protein [Thalassoglobus sp.]|uniref:hypothetical protein n=1 Tax=Thalassoglobus sp. TaxID=2795869 RepID=UPI003AA8336C
MAVRSGRFKIKNTTTNSAESVLIHHKTRSVYRFFNSGEKPFQLKQNLGGGQKTVEAKNSIDFELRPDKGELILVVGAGETAQGMYDFVESSRDVRNGRFSLEMSNSTSAATIIFGRDRTLYRVFNSGKVPFKLKNGSNAAVVVPSKQSLDIVVEGNVKISTNSTTAILAEAIYDIVTDSKPIRSGRFNRRASGTPNEFHQIIDIRDLGASPYLLYRILNSGDEDIEIVARKDPSDSAEEQIIFTLPKKQSFDFGIDEEGFDSRKTIGVRSTGANKAIKGIYEFLGNDTAT